MWSFIFEYRLNIIACTGSIFFLIFILENVRRERLKEAYSLIWIGMGILFVFFSAWQKGLGYISSFVGIYYSPAMLFLLLIVMILLILLQYSIIISKQTDKIKTLTQELALLRTDIIDKTDNIEKNSNK